MISTIEIENKLKEIKPFLIQNYHVDKIGYFGSFTRNEQTSESDLDIIVSFYKPVGWEFFDLQEYLENELRVKVDLVSERALKEQLRQIILDSVKYI